MTDYVNLALLVPFVPQLFSTISGDRWGTKWAKICKYRC